MSFAAFASNVSDLWFPAMDDIVCVLRSAGSLAVPVFDHDELITLSSVNPRQLKVVAPVRVMLLFPVVRSGSWPSISDHNWPRVWQLGGENVGRGPYATYKEMVAGYRDMMHDDVLAMTATGDTVSGTFAAYEGGNRVQTYAFAYTIRDGAIISAAQHIVTTRTRSG
jgi:hypothetical protein